MAKPTTQEEIMEYSQEAIKEERAFLHDISTPLMVSMGMLDYIHKKDPIEDEVIKAKFEKAQAALEKLAQLVKTRRQQLIERTTYDK